jgi:hypothetical protein
MECLCHSWPWICHLYTGNWHIWHQFCFFSSRIRKGENNYDKHLALMQSIVKNNILIDRHRHCEFENCIIYLQSTLHNNVQSQDIYIFQDIFFSRKYKQVYHDNQWVVSQWSQMYLPNKKIKPTIDDTIFKLAMSMPIDQYIIFNYRLH